jgi:glycerol-3-phosphate acyltransferase PlsY
MSELPRRLWHIFGGLCLATAGLLVEANIFLPGLISATAAFLILEFTRLKFARVNRRFLAFFHLLLREREASTLTGSAYLLIAACIVFLLCDKYIAVMAVAFVAVGDPVAGMVGERWGKAKVRGKTLARSSACLVSCLAIGAILTAITDVGLWLVLIGAVCATAVESLSLPVNDNLTIPLVSGGVMMLANMGIMM